MKNYLIGFILGAIIFSGITAIAITSISADNVNYSEGVTVKDKIDNLYTKVRPNYIGSTTITPSTSTQTLNTNNKVLTSDITINSIPSTYKNLTDTTTALASDILSGKTAYDNDGNLMTGTLSSSDTCTAATLYIGLRTHSDGTASFSDMVVKGYKSITVNNLQINTYGNRTFTITYNNTTYKVGYLKSVTISVVSGADTMRISSAGTSNGYAVDGRISLTC